MAKSSNAEEQPPRKEFPGRTLRQIREQAGISINEISEKTLISIARLEALEQDDYQKVGGIAYITGYARAYAKTLGVDPKPFINQLEQALDLQQPIAESGSLQNMTVEPAHKHRALLARLAMIAIVLIFAAVLYLLIGRDDTAAPVPAANPVIAPVVEPATSDTATPDQSLLEATETTIEATEDSAEERVEEVSGAESTEPPETESNESIEASSEGVEASVSESIAASVAPSSRESIPSESLLSTTTTADVEDSQIDLSFTEACWVQVWDANGKLLIAQTANSGDNLQLFGPAPFEVKLGFAEAASIKFNGEPVEFEPRPGHRTHRMTVGESQ